MNTDKTSASFLSVFIGVHPWPKCLFGFGWYASSSSFHEIRSPETLLALFAFVPIIRCSGRGADTRVCSADTHVGAAVYDMLQFVQLNEGQPAGGLIGFAASGTPRQSPRNSTHIETAA
jgi:hypothetical protein